MTGYTYEKNDCQQCTRSCWCIIWIDELCTSNILCQSCFEDMKASPDMKIVVDRIFKKHGIPQLEPDSN
jgi:hypothetical protein